MAQATDAGPATTAPASSAATGAKAQLDDFLGQYGLSGLGDFAWNEYLNGTPVSQIMLDIRQQPAYQQRFPAMAELAKQGRAITEADYINIENSYRQVYHAYGIPAGIFDKPSDFTKLIVGDVSPTELNDRVKMYTDAVMNDTEVLNQISTLYGQVGHTNNPAGDLLAHYLDPTAAVPVLEQQLNAAKFAAVGKESGYGQLTAAQATQYGAQQGTTPQQAQQGFGALVANRELFQALPGEQAATLGQDVQLGAAFGGSELDKEAIQNQARLRVAEGSGGGGFTQTQRGAVGLQSQNV